jgi:hypothetical protein
VASLSSGQHGRRVQFISHDGKRKTLYLGKLPLKAAESVRSRVESILACQVTRTPIDRDTAQWIAGLSPEMRAKLARVGLVEKPENATDSTLGAFLVSYSKGRVDLQGSSRLTHGHVIRNLLSFFDPKRELRTITPADADAFRVYLVTQGLSENTARRRIGFCRQFFRAAMRSGAFPKSEANPFAHIPASVIENTERMRFIERAVVDDVLKACPNGQWRAMVALARYGGLRVPSEPLALKRSAIDWEKRRITVKVPKLHRIPNKSTRIIPLFPELIEPLREAIAEYPDSEWVITKYRDPASNLASSFDRIVESAGHPSWPKPWTNMRSSRETELAEEYPIHVVCAWIGNSPDVAVRHYLQLRPEHWSKAAGDPTQNPTRQESATVGSALQGDSDNATDNTPIAKRDGESRASKRKRNSRRTTRPSGFIGRSIWIPQF